MAATLVPLGRSPTHRRCQAPSSHSQSRGQSRSHLQMHCRRRSLAVWTRHQLPMPTVCAVHGSAYGGAMELAIFCDIILASDDMKIGVPEIKLGVFPPLAMAHLAHIVGIKKAAELMFTGAALSADEAPRRIFDYV